MLARTDCPRAHTRRHDTEGIRGALAEGGEGEELTQLSPRVQTFFRLFVFFPITMLVSSSTVWEWYQHQVVTSVQGVRLERYDVRTLRRLTISTPKQQ